mmetsp:Transcript_30518/g.76591  ORF Transcript_30518/g.76591 Transcript_30518/m.76591 type:complete len:145 (+) Transcript_30518:342-776(+)|eukprot:CAMPEP_0177655784 /NCGR_PEP_ID=MMETSP0447-20121125/15173_1 /TAXON_ID=0 /ORGANISM="Stygamoeba regulata, Strain BSH-02190019" /LENGTH=144 /DNA_ID=CAMNT_0019159769 /DNA_START=337 /DNA_END=771 /DNA_ORIENTATION=-
MATPPEEKHEPPPPTSKPLKGILKKEGDNKKGREGKVMLTVSDETHDSEVKQEKKAKKFIESPNGLLVKDESGTIHQIDDDEEDNKPKKKDPERMMVTKKKEPAKQPEPVPVPVPEPASAPVVEEEHKKKKKKSEKDDKDCLIC